MIFSKVPRFIIELTFASAVNYEIILINWPKRLVALISFRVRDRLKSNLLIISRVH
ncbi:MAG: hypothetical protein ACTS4T_00385 [Candidatus Hodgkinia cicadicola]